MAAVSFQEERRENTISLREDLVVAEVPFEVFVVHQGVVGAGAVEGVVVVAEVYADIEDEVVAWEFASIQGIGEREGGGAAYGLIVGIRGPYLGLSVSCQRCTGASAVLDVPWPICLESVNSLLKFVVDQFTSCVTISVI